MDIKELDLVDPATNWYYQSKLVAVRKHLQDINTASILVDVGAGSGFFGLNLDSSVRTESLHFIDPEYAFKVPSSVASCNTHNECPHISGDTYLFIDVLEHVTNDVELLTHYVEEANAGAKFALSVPAFMALWSPHDVFLEHKKRYTKRELEQVAANAGLQVTNSYYLFSFLTPLIYVIRKIKNLGSNVTSDMKNFPSIVNTILSVICKFEHKFFENKLFGLTVIVFAEKIS